MIGPLADSKADTEGSWMVFGHVPAAVTVLEGIRAKLGPDAKIAYAKGPEIKRAIPSFFDDFPGAPKPIPQTPEQAEAAFQEAIETARGADRVLMVLGETAQMAGEAASRASLVAARTPGGAAAGRGRARQARRAGADQRPAAGDRVGRGERAGDPRGLGAGQRGRQRHRRRPVRRREPRRQAAGQLPPRGPDAHLLRAQPDAPAREARERYRSRYWDGPSQPVYPFGHGLSYTTFAYSNLKLAAPSVKIGQQAAVTVDVRNTGAVAGDEVVQLYLHQRYGSDSRPVRELKGFERVALAPGETKTVRFMLGPDELGYWSTAKGRWLQDAARFDVWVGGDSTATAHAELVGP